MKKLLLLVLFVSFGMSLNAQIFWDKKATTFAAASRGVTKISYGKVDPNAVWLYAYDGVTTSNVIQEFSRSSDGGNTWTSGSINLGNTTLGIGDIQAIDATTAYVIAYVSAGGAGGGVWKTTNGGTTWVKQTTASFNTPTDTFPDFINFWDANEGIAVGDPASGYFEIYKTTNGGANWTRLANSPTLPAPLTGEYAYVHNSEVDGNTIRFGTNLGRLFVSNDKGATWNAYQSPITDWGGTASSGHYAFQDANNGIMIDNNWSFWRTSDGGANWVSEVPNGVLRDGALCHVPGTPNFYVCLGTDLDLSVRGSSYTTDGGLNWIDINPLGDNSTVNGTGAVDFSSTTNGIAAGFNTSSTVGGVFKYVGTQIEDARLALLATPTFSNDNAFKAYPNPTTGLVALTGKNITNVIVTDVLGKQVSNTNYTSLSNVNLDMSALNAGMYMVKVTNNEGNASTLKVVKQ
jgi:photosystem II stability/assembly factor-like uncharacterized protein